MTKPFQFSVRTVLFGMTGIAMFAGACKAASVLPFEVGALVLFVAYVIAWGTTGGSLGVDQSDTIKGYAFGALAGLVVGCLALYPVMVIFYLAFAFGGLLAK